MASYSVAEARDSFDELVERAAAGEAVTVTRNGAPLVELVPSKPAQETLGVKMDPAWFRARRVTPTRPLNDPVHVVQQMREERGY